MMKNNFKKTFLKVRGGSLVELLIYMGLLLMLIAVFTQIFSSLVEVQLESQADSFIDQDYQYITSKLQHDVRRASSITVPSVVENSTSTLSLVIGGNTFTYALSGSNLAISDGQSTENLNSSEAIISNLSFTLTGNAEGKPAVSTSMKLTSRTKPVKGEEERDLNLTLGLR